MAGVADYATTADVAALYPQGDATGLDSAAFTRFLHVASRGVDRYTDRFFYADGSSTKYFDIKTADLNRFFVPAGLGDFYSPSAIKIALNPNSDPADATQWVTLSGDGVTPPSNYFLLPDNPPYVGSATSASARQPYFGIELPEQSNPNDATNYRASFTKGQRTLAITANWGWPAIPDDIVQVTAKIAVKMYRSRDAGWTGQTGSPEIGNVQIIKFLDASDFAVLEYYSRQSV